MENDIKTIVVKLTGLESQFTTLEQKVEGIANHLHGLPEKVDTLEKTVGALKQKVDTLEKKVDAGFQSTDKQFKDVGENLAGIVDMLSQRFGDQEETRFLTERYGQRLDRLEDDMRVLKTRAGIH